jgi:hypothetical protein
VRDDHTLCFRVSGEDEAEVLQRATAVDPRIEAEMPTLTSYLIFTATIEWGKRVGLLRSACCCCSFSLFWVALCFIITVLSAEHSVTLLRFCCPAFFFSNMAGLPVYKEGWLWKVGGSIQTWKKRWMVLHGPVLDYYKNSDVSGNPKGSISLDGASVTALLDNNEFSSPTQAHYSLFGITPIGSSRMYVIQAANDAERDSWIAMCANAGAFKVEVTPLSLKTQPDSILEGWLDKYASSRTLGGLFQKSSPSERFYFALMHDKIAYWKNTQTSTQPIEHLLLSKESILELITRTAISGVEIPPFEIISRKGEPKWILGADGKAMKADWVTAIGKTIRGEKYIHPAYNPPVRGSVLSQQQQILSHQQKQADAAASSKTSAATTALPSPATPISSAASSSLPAPPSQVSQNPASQSTKLKRGAGSARNLKQGATSDSDSEDESEMLPPPPPPPQTPGADGAVVASADVDSEDDANEFLDETTATNKDVPEAVDIHSLLANRQQSIGGIEEAELPPPPPPPNEEPLSPPSQTSGPSFTPTMSPTASPDKILGTQPDVLLQLNNILASRFGNDAAAMQQFLTTYFASSPTHANGVTGAPSLSIGGAGVPAVETGDVSLDAVLGQNRKLSSKLQKLLISDTGKQQQGVLKRAMLHVHLLEARDLPAMDSNGFSDPYCVVHVRPAGGGKKKEKHKHAGPKSDKDKGTNSSDAASGDAGGDDDDLVGTAGKEIKKIKSKTMSETLDPVWDQEMTLDVFDFPDSASSASSSASSAIAGTTSIVDKENFGSELVVDVYDFDRFSTDDFIGRAVIPLSTLRRHHDGLSGWYPLAALKESWQTVGTVFLSAVLDEHVIDESTRNQKSNVAFLQMRHQLLIKQEEKHFLKQQQIQTKMLSSASASGQLAAAARKNLISHSTPSPAAEKLRVFIGTWNVGNAPPPDDLTPWIPLYAAEIYVIGTQECNYTPRRDIKTCKVDWQMCLTRHFGRDYTMVKYHSLWEIRIAVFVRNSIHPSVTSIQAFSEATGIGNVLGNKGGCVVAVNYKGIKLCFVNSHLAAHQNQCDDRNANYRSIVKNIKVGSRGTWYSDLLNEFHHLIWMGDLNYRLDFGDPSEREAKSPSAELFSEMVEMISGGHQGDREALFKTDQLARESREKRAFVGFLEGAYEFPPTFKVKRHTKLEYTVRRQRHRQRTISFFFSFFFFFF